MSDFKAKMHQIQFLLGLCPRPCWGSLQCSPDPLAGFKGSNSKRGYKRGKREREGGGEGKEGEREGREMDGMGSWEVCHPFQNPDLPLLR